MAPHIDNDVSNRDRDTARKRLVFNIGRASAAFTRWVGSVSSVIVHSILFIGSFSLVFLGVHIDKVLLVVTTLVSLEAIYLAIFIQMTINRNTAQLHNVGQDIEELSEDIEDIQEDMEEISEDVDELQEDVEEITEPDEETLANDKLEKIEQSLMLIVKEIENLKNKSPQP